MGRSYDDIMRNDRRAGDEAASQRENTTLKSQTRVFPVEFPQPKPTQSTHSNNADDSYDIASLEDVAENEENNALVTTGSFTVRTDKAFYDSYCIPAPWGLVDPLFKDMSHLSRFYLSHFSQHLLEILALYPHVKNPYRDLIPLVRGSPVLEHTLSALGALHHALRVKGDVHLINWAPINETPDGNLLFFLDEQRGAIDSLYQTGSRAFGDFLDLKQRALNQLSTNLRDTVMRNDDRTVAAILGLALLDAIESGSGVWKLHLEGAKNLLKTRQQTPQLYRGVVNGLETLVVGGCLMIDIMGSTLARPGSLSRPFYSSSMGPDILKRLEETSWVGCPAYLLEVIFFVHAAWYSDKDENSERLPRFHFSSSLFPGDSVPSLSPRSLLEHIRSFDPLAWAHDMQKCLFLTDLTTRIALATTYKAAVYLYAGRVFSSTACGFSPKQMACLPLPLDHAVVANELVEQMCLIPETDLHFKCLIWPAFIAGAECRYPYQRTLVLDTLNVLYRITMSVNVRNAAHVLRLMWEKQELRRQGRRIAGLAVEHEVHGQSWHSETATANATSTTLATDLYSPVDEAAMYDAGFDWIQELVNSNVDWLFI